MKKLLKYVIITIATITIIACNNKDENDTKKENPFVGTWKLIEIYDNPDLSSGSWNTVNNGYTYTFSKNGKFISTRFSECNVGNYTIQSDKLSLKFGCAGFTTGIENPAGTFIEQFTFESNKVIFNPTYLSCEEGCGLKFEKIN